MSGAVIDSKISKAMKKVGAKLGYTFKVYRPYDYLTPMKIANYLFTETISWSKDESFKEIPVAPMAQYKIYAEYSKLQAGDILECDLPERVFMITEVDVIRGATGILVDDSFDLLRTVYTPTADKKTSFEVIGESIPCAFKFKRVSENTVQSAMMKTPSTVIEIMTMVPTKFVKLADVIVVGGDKYLVTAVNNSEAGIKIDAVSLKAGT